MAKRLLIAGVLLVVFSCSKGKVLTEKYLKQSNVMNGVEVKKSDFVKNHVVAIIDTELNTICTGTIIANDVILTAAHCAPEKANHLKIIFNEDAYGTLDTREQDYYQAYVRSATDFIPHSEYSDSSEDDTDLDDIALVKFRGTLPEGYAPVKMLDRVEELKRGLNLLVAGYGVDEVVTEVIDPNTYPNLSEALETGAAFCNEDNSYCVSVEASGDGTLRKAQAPIDSFSKNEFILNEKAAGTCSGDSGGPAFVQKGKELVLAGVTSRGGVLCNDDGVYTNVARYRDWIKKTVAQLK